MRLYDLNAYGNDHFVNIWIGTTIHALASCAVRSKDSKKMLEGTALIPWFAVEGIWTDIQSMGWNPRRTEFCAKCAISPITV
jgi:hypothetical protein